MWNASFVSGISAVVGLGAGFIASVISADLAAAQGVFCPAAVSSPGPPFNTVPLTGVGQSFGNCTNPKLAGAFSGAALASQAIGDLAGSTTIVQTSIAVQAVEERREAPVEPCPAGEVLVDGICKAPPSPTPSVTQISPTGPVSAPTATPIAPSPVVSKRLGAKVPKRRPPQVAAAQPLPVRKPSAPRIYDQSFRIGAWAQGFGDYEHRTGDRNSIVNCCTEEPTNTNITPVQLEATSNLSSGGFVGGIDGTKRGLWLGQDGLTFGLLGGYSWTDISLNTTVVSSDPARMASGSSRTTANINGPSLGGYVSYFNAAFSNDFFIKNDFLSLNETQSQLLGFGLCSCLGSVSPFVSPQSGSGSTNLDQVTIADDVSYKLPWQSWMWIAPTAGVRYLNSTYSSSAQALGLADGYIFKIQGGAKVGWGSAISGVRVTTVLTGLIFSDVIVHGNNIQGGSFGPEAAILSDQGKVQGEGIAMVNLDFGRGLSASVEGDIYGTNGVFGAGGKATVRMQW